MPDVKPETLKGADEARVSPASGSTKPIGKVLVVLTADWFALSHFQPLIRRLVRIAGEVVVVARSTGRLASIQALGARTIDLAFDRSSMNPVSEALIVRQLARVIATERPDVVHLVAMKPIVLGGLATAIRPVPSTIVHMTGLGFLAISETTKTRLVRRAALAVIRSVLRRRGSWLLVENPEDQQFLVDGGAEPGSRVTMLGGAGIDPEVFAAQPDPGNPVPIAAFVARMIRPKGVDVLMDAARRLHLRGVPLVVELFGDTDPGNPEAVPAAQLQQWDDGRALRWMGHTRDVAAVWRRADIFVLPARSREGMPRALLEAAASARPSIVTDVPGCRHFVTDGVEGLIVPPGDVEALSRALERLAGDPDLRRRLGAAARAKVVAGYTEAAVEAAIEATYRQLQSTTRSPAL